MRPIFATTLCTAMLAFGADALAAEQTVTLAVKNMTCASCPYIVKQSLAAVSGVSDVKVSFKKKNSDCDL